MEGGLWGVVGGGEGGDDREGGAGGAGKRRPCVFTRKYSTEEVGALITSMVLRKVLIRRPLLQDLLRQNSTTLAEWVALAYFLKDQPLLQRRLRMSPLEPSMLLSTPV